MAKYLDCEMNPDEFWGMVLKELPPEGTPLFELFMAALHPYKEKVSGFLGAGNDSIVLTLENGNIFKLFKFKGMGKERAFDVPIIERGTITAEDSDGTPIKVHYAIQQNVRMGATYEDVLEFSKKIEKAGYCFEDPGSEQVGFLGNELVLIDYFAVRGTSD